MPGKQGGKQKPLKKPKAAGGPDLDDVGAADEAAAKQLARERAKAEKDAAARAANPKGFVKK